MTLGIADGRSWDAGDGETLHEGQRLGRFVLLRDQDGVLHAVSAGAVAALCGTDDGTVVMLPGGRMVRVEQSLSTVLGWFVP